jgi:inorganic pyrophosphatase
MINKLDNQLGGLIGAFALLLISSCSPQHQAPVNLLFDIQPMNADGTLNAVIEIPAGTLAKYETSKETGEVIWSENSDGTKRTVDYLAYPANYGMIPGTWLPANLGGDNDPLDVFVLGAALERGSIVRVRIVGVMHAIDSGQHDDKLIAVQPSGAFSGVTDLNDLNRSYPGALTILETWLTNYKRANSMHLASTGSADTAYTIVRQAISAFADFPAQAQQ